MYECIDSALFYILMLFAYFDCRTGKKCLFKEADVGATLESYKRLPQGDEDALQKAVSSQGPISVAIDASRRSFHFYKEGTYYEPGYIL